MSLLLTLPLLIPLTSVAVGLLGWRSLRVQRTAGLAGACGLLIVAAALVGLTSRQGMLTVQVGAWPAPAGITLAADLFSSLMLLLAAILGTAAGVFALVNVEEVRQRYGFYPLLNAILLGANGVFLTGDIFNLYVFVEITLMASFAMLTLGGQRDQLEAGLKYVTLSLIGSALLLAACGLIYATVHTLNMADLSVKLEALYADRPGLVLALGILLLLTFAMKAAVFPLFFWLPSAHPTLPAAGSAIFSGLLTKVGTYGLIRLLCTCLPIAGDLAQPLLLLAGLGMIVGVLGAVAQYEIRRVLSFHTVSQIGYVIMGIGLLGDPDPDIRRLGAAAAILFVLHHGIVKGCLFLVGGIIKSLRGTYQLKKLGGLTDTVPWLAVLFFAAAISLAGLPPLSGFWAKLGLVRAGLLAGEYGITAIALLTGVFTLISMTKIWNEAFWKDDPHPEDAPAHPPMPRAKQLLLAGPVTLLVLLTLAVGLYPQPVLELADTAAGQLLDIRAYRDAVLGENWAQPLIQATADCVHMLPEGGSP